MRVERPAGPPASQPVHGIRIGVVLLALGLPAGGHLLAVDVSGYVELEATSIDRETEDSDGLLSEQETQGFAQTYNLLLSQDIYPNLRFFAGGLFKRTDANLETLAPVRTETDATVTTRRPYAKLTLGSGLYRGDFSYTLIDERQEADGGPTRKDVRETISTSIGWFPDGYPSARLRFFRSNTYDGDRTVVDLTEDRFELTSLYDGIESLNLRYRGNRTETKDRLNANLTRNESHNARIIYGDSFWNNRLSLSSDYNGTVRKTETATSGVGEVDLPLFPFGGLSGIDDTPEEGPLTSNTALIDGNLTDGAGVNLGLPPPGGNDEPRQVGLDFGVQTELNTLLVWVDRDLPAEVVDSFAWDVYTSTDNQDWVFQQTVSPGIFGGAFLTRFELRFTNVTTRYIKVVTDPLAPTTPMATDFPLILVTELQPTVRIPADQAERDRSETTHIYNLSSRLRILESPFLYYEFDTLLTDTSTAGTTYSHSNGLSLNHAFNDVYSMSARLTREGSRESFSDRQAWIYTAALVSRALEKWRNRVVFSGRNEKIDGVREYRNSILFYTILELYRGLDLNFGIGRNFDKIAGNTRRDSRLVNAIVKLAPHRRLNVNLIYRDTSEDVSGVQRPESERKDSVQEVTVGYTPFQSLYFFGSYQETQRSGQDERTIRNLTLNWTPFPEGALRFSFNYNESYRSDDGSTTRNFFPTVRWTIRRTSYFEVSYQRLRTDSTLRETDAAGVVATFRTSF